MYTVLIVHCKAGAVLLKEKNIQYVQDYFKLQLDYHTKKLLDIFCHLKSPFLHRKSSKDLISDFFQALKELCALIVGNRCTGRHRGRLLLPRVAPTPGGGGVPSHRVYRSTV